jgi:transcriptional regulator with XRE-family HTH domain
MIREAIKNELDRLGWSARKLSTETGVRYPSVTEYLNGKRDISGTNLELIIKRLFMENSTLEIANAKLHKAYLRENNISTYDMRSFEFWDKGVQFTKIKHLLNALSCTNLTEEEKQARDLVLASGVDRIENGLEFIKQLILK